MNKHTFLVEQGLWNAYGHYYDEKMAKVIVEGQSKMIHGPCIWLNESFMRLVLSTPIEFKNVYEIKPFAENSDTTTFSSINPAIGRLIGTFTIVDDTIVQLYHSADGIYSGCEYMLKIDDGHYKSTGVFLKGDQKISSWAVDLVRE